MSKPVEVSYGWDKISFIAEMDVGTKSLRDMGTAVELFKLVLGHVDVGYIDPGELLDAIETEIAERWPMA